MADVSNDTDSDAEITISKDEPKARDPRGESGWVRVPARSRVQIDPDVPHPWMVEARTEDGKSDRQQIHAPTSGIVLSDEGGNLKIKASPPESC